MFLDRVARQADGERGPFSFHRMAGDRATEVADGFADDEQAEAGGLRQGADALAEAGFLVKSVGIS